MDYLLYKACFRYHRINLKQSFGNYSDGLISRGFIHVKGWGGSDTGKWLMIYVSESVILDLKEYYTI